MAFTHKLVGLRELERALGQIEKQATKRTVARRVLNKAALPIRDDARADAPKDKGNLEQSIVVSGTLSRSQRKRKDKSVVERYVGTNNPAGLQQEFGNSRHGAQPFMRPSWDKNKNNALSTIISELEIEIEKTVRRQNARRLRSS